MVAIPNHHFFQWVNQLKDSGYEVNWFDITDGGPKSEKIAWVHQIKGWKLKWDFPLRTKIKKYIPKLYSFILKYNQNNTSKVFQKTIDTIKPDIVHCFEMQLSGLPILSVMEQNTIPLIYSSWGSDVFYYEHLGVSTKALNRFYNRTNYLITDCKRDYKLAVSQGFKNKFLGVFPGNGGLSVDSSKIHSASKRQTLLIKGYDDGVGKASVVLQAIGKVSKHLLNDKEIVVYSADHSIDKQIKSSRILQALLITIHSRYKFIQNEALLEIMGKSCIHIANSMSDGMPNALLEAMAMGAFPIQSNPGGVTEEVIVDGESGFLISNPLDADEIANHIENALEDLDLRTKAQDKNINFINHNYKRSTLQSKIVQLYKEVLLAD